MKVLAGIVLYNPDLIRLKENFDHIKNQVDCLVIVDNGSNSILYRNILCDSKCVFIRHDENLGIANALNEIMEYAYSHSYAWVLTLDQDSVASDNLISSYFVYIDRRSLAMITPIIKDRNASLKEEEFNEEESKVEYCITSGSFVCVEAWRTVGGFDGSMFIDYVDFDFCASLREKGWEILKISKSYILHEVGHARVITIFGKDRLSYNHVPFRYYYIVRNNLYFGRKHHLFFRQLKNVIRLFYIVIFYEPRKISKIFRMICGLLVGLSYPIRKI